MNNKRILSILFLITILIPISISNRNIIISNDLEQKSINNAQREIIFKYGTDAGPMDLDPANAWDSASADVIFQVCEGLYTYNRSDPNLMIIPWLASSLPVIGNGGLSYTCNLRTGITFQDGYAFDVLSAKKSFDRLLNGFINTGISQFTSLYKPIGGESVINNTVANANDSITFNLNYVYSPFLALLCFSGSFIVSPSISLNPYYNTTFLNVGNSSDILIGTGPYKYEEYITNDHVSFTRYDNYWGGPNGIYSNSNIQNLIFQIYSDSNTRNTELSKGNIHMINEPNVDYLTPYYENNTIQLIQGPSSTIIQYIGMNTQLIPIPVREACSYAFNYSYANNIIMQGRVDRMTSPIPLGIIGSDAKNSSLNYPIMNITYARQVLIDNGYTSDNSMTSWLADPTNDTVWFNASSHEPLLAYNYTYNSDNTIRQDIGTLLQSNLAAIGVNLTIVGVLWNEFLGYLYGINGFSQNDLNFFFIGWKPDYNDPSNYIIPLFTPFGEGNSTQLNDPQLNAMINAALQTTNNTERMGIYSAIQQRIVEQLFPWIMVYVPQTWGAWKTGVIGVQLDPMGYVHFGPVSYIQQYTASGPRNLTAQSGFGSIFLMWEAPVVTNGLTVIGYIIYRGTSSGNEVALTTVGDIYSYNDTGLQLSQIYYYEISVIFNGGIESSKSSEIAAISINFANLLAPRNINAQSGIESIVLMWESPLNTNGLNITGYKIYRGTSSGSEVPLITVGNVTSYNDTGLQADHPYYYEISAIFSGGIESSKSNEIAATPLNSTTSNPYLNPTTGIPGYNLILMGFTIISSTTVIILIIKKKRT